MAKKKTDSNTIATNRKARFEYEVLEEIETGICLVGTEVKSLRAGKCNIAESYADAKTVDGHTDIYLLGATIPVYAHAARKMNHDPIRPRKLLLHARETKRLLGKVQTKGLTLVPLSIYFNSRGLVKLKLALVRGKKLHDKRQTQKDRDWQRDKERIMKESG